LKTSAFNQTQPYQTQYYLSDLSIIPSHHRIPSTFKPHPPLPSPQYLSNPSQRALCLTTRYQTVPSQHTQPATSSELIVNLVCNSDHNVYCIPAVAMLLVQRPSCLHLFPVRKLNPRALKPTTYITPSCRDGNIPVALTVREEACDIRPRRTYIQPAGSMNMFSRRR
jgi:hypothetical protein